MDDQRITQGQLDAESELYLVGEDILMHLSNVLDHLSDVYDVDRGDLLATIDVMFDEIVIKNRRDIFR